MSTDPSEGQTVDSKGRFSNRVDTYVKCRPSYPRELIDYLYGEVGFNADSEIADIGAGTGIFTKLLLERGSRVNAVEPNSGMRDALLRELAGHSNLRVMTGSAEATGLPDGSVDFIVSAQAFHWFDRAAAKGEFRRILRPGGLVALIWNTRPTKGTPFLEAYEQLLHRYGTDYGQVNHRNLSEDDLIAFFRPGTMRKSVFANPIAYDYEGLRGRMQSSSYIPVPGDPNHEPLMAEFRDLFARSEQDGQVVVAYETEVYIGEIGKTTLHSTQKVYNCGNKGGMSE